MRSPGTANGDWGRCLEDIYIQRDQRDQLDLCPGGRIGSFSKRASDMRQKISREMAEGFSLAPLQLVRASAQMIGA
jgi:hypothetical protein